MQYKHVINICKLYKLGDPVGAPARVYGGLLHSMWRLTTDKSIYAVKQLSQGINLEDETIKENYEISEYIASSFSERGISAICALNNVGKYLSIIDGTGFLVYPWIDAKVVEDDYISEEHALEISIIIAKMHSIKLSIPRLLDANFDFQTSVAISEVINQSVIANCPFAIDLKKNSTVLIDLNNAYLNAIPILKTNVVISHADLDQKNVLWDEEDNPILIDWESARKVNPTYDIIGTAFDWSGIATNDFNQELFIKMVDLYQKTCGNINVNHLAPSFYGVMGNYLNWLVYNIKRACVADDLELKNLGIEQVNKTLTKILRLNNIGLHIIGSLRL